LQRKHTLATPNYGYEKRQKELAKKKKKEEKLKAKSEKKVSPDGDVQEATIDEAGNPVPPAAT
jgi:hypothetical protein